MLLVDCSLLSHVTHVRRQEAKKFTRLIKFAEAYQNARYHRSQIRQPALEETVRINTQDSVHLFSCGPAVSLCEETEVLGLAHCGRDTSRSNGDVGN